VGSTFSSSVRLNQPAASPNFIIENDTFMKDGEPMQIKAGCIHYSRVPEEYWEDRLMRLRAMGLNAIQTYVPWNWHVAEQGKPNFSGDRNITKFILTAQKAGLLVVLRAGPYMCGEWEFGGLPAWLFENGDIKLRTNAEPYMTYVQEYWSTQLLPVIKPLIYSNGGPVVMMQVENEYGSYGNVEANPSDKQYMENLIQIARTSLGEDLVLFTTDGGDTGYMTRGTLKGSSVYSVGDGCGNPQTCIDAQKEFNAPGMSPFMCSECYTGWLTHWGEGGANTSSSAPHVDAILKLNGSISLYMGHGGTNWGFWSGVNGGGGTSFQPHETSYDYDSPVSEGGEHGYNNDVDKYAAMQNVFSKYHMAVDGTIPSEPVLLPRTAYGNVTMAKSAPILANIGALSPGMPNVNATPPTMESLRCHYGFMLYTTTLTAGTSASKLDFGGVKDRVQAFVDGVYQGTSYRVSPTPITINAKSGAVLQILLENMGRINYGHGMDQDSKGIFQVTVDGIAVSNWKSQCLPMDNITGVDFQPVPSTTAQATFFTGTFNIDSVSPPDTFALMNGWTKGSLWVNGFNLGRYWQPQGPQLTLYVPGSKLVQGQNTIVVLELDNASPTLQVELVEQPQLQKPPTPPGLHCDPTATATAGSTVKMLVESPKIAHQQMWKMVSGQIQLSSDPTLCLTIETGCPHASDGCVVVDKCAASNEQQQFVLEQDPTQPNSTRLKCAGGCLDIYSHDAFNGSPLDVWQCYGNEDNQRFSFDASMGHLKSAQPASVPGDFLVTVCSAK